MIMNRKSGVTLLSSKSGVNDHRARLVLYEKAVSFDVEFVDLNKPPEDFLTINPYHTLPVLIDRELILNETSVLVEYLDERFPYPPLLPVYPVMRAKARLTIHRIERDWYPLLESLQSKPKDETVIDQIHAVLKKVEPIFKDKPYFLSTEFSLIDCAVAPFLWRLPHLGVEIDANSALNGYQERLFSRPSFEKSLSEDERIMGGGRYTNEI